MNRLKIFFLSTFIVFVYSHFVVAEELVGEDADLSFLPPSFNVQTKETTRKNVLIEDDNNNGFQFTLDNIFQHHNEDSSPNWSNLSRFAAQADTALQGDLSFKTHLLLNVYTRDNDSFRASHDLRLDIKEAYLSWQQSPTLFFDVGRVNIKSGVATGFNPTDYFKVGSLLDRNTEDISQLRDARLGSLVMRGQKLWDGGSLTLVASPKISNKTNHWTTGKEIVGFNFHKSNDRSRIMLKLNQLITENFTPEIIYYNESGKHNLGINISQSVNDQWIAYSEWNIGKRRNLIDEALRDQRKSHQLLPSIIDQFANDSGEEYLQQLAIGASFTSGLNITTKLEYQYNQAGLSHAEASKWFDAMQNPDAIGQLMSIRGLAQNRNEPLGQHSLFLRSNGSDIMVDKLDFTGLLITDLNDHSHLIQIEAEYELNSKSSISLKLAKFRGDKESIYGSLDNGVSSTLQYVLKF